MPLREVFERIARTPVRGEAERLRIESILRVVLWIGAFVGASWLVLGALVLPRDGSLLVLLGLGLVALALAGRELARGEPLRASWTLVGWLIALTSVGMITQGSAVQGGYLLAIITASLLLGARQVAAVTALCLISLASVATLPEFVGLQAPAQSEGSGWLAAIVLCSAAALLIEASRRSRASAVSDRQNRSALARSNHELRASRDRYESLAEHAHDLVSELDEQGRFLYVNHAFHNVLGFPPAALLGRASRELAAPALAGEQAAEFGAGQAEGMLFRARHMDGSSRFLENRAARYRTPDGQLRTTVISRDVTFRIESEERVRRLEERMARTQRIESLGLLASGIAHDFNNLLVAILANADDVLGSLDEDDPLFEPVGDIARAGEGAADLVRQLLAYTGKGELEPGPLDLSDLVQDTVRMLRVGSRDAAAIELEVGADSVWIRADSAQIRQVILNLLTNALESLDTIGRVTLRTGVVHLDEVALADCSLALDASEGEFAYLEVADTGRGMRRDTLDRVFEPFYTTRPTGRGLGLSTVMGVVRSHQGALELSSELGVGTSVRVLFPAFGLHPAAAVERPFSGHDDRRQDEARLPAGQA